MGEIEMIDGKRWTRWYQMDGRVFVVSNFQACFWIPGVERGVWVDVWGVGSLSSGWQVLAGCLGRKDVLFFSPRK